MAERVHDSIVIGAGPGGLQAAIYLGRYRRDVLLIDRSGGRTWHASRIENVLTHERITGREIVERGMKQAKRYGVRIERDRVISVRKEGVFTVSTPAAVHHAFTVVVASGVYDIIPPLRNIFPFLGTGYYTCLDCDGYELTDRKVVVTGDSLEAVHEALAIRQLYTKDVTFIPYRFVLPDTVAEVLAEEGIRIVDGEPGGIIGKQRVEGVELAGGERVPCDAVMAVFGIKLNDDFLEGLRLKKDARGVRYVVNSAFESSVRGLYIVGPLNTGQDQVVIAAGEGAAAAIDINKRLLEEKEVREEEYAGVDHA